MDSAEPARHRSLGQFQLSQGGLISSHLQLDDYNKTTTSFFSVLENTKQQWPALGPACQPSDPPQPELSPAINTSYERPSSIKETEGIPIIEREI